MATNADPIAFRGALGSFEEDAARTAAMLVCAGLTACGASALRASRRTADQARAISGLLLPELP